MTHCYLFARGAVRPQKRLPGALSVLDSIFEVLQIKQDWRNKCSYQWFNPWILYKVQRNHHPYPPKHLGESEISQHLWKPGQREVVHGIVRKLNPGPLH